MAHLGLSQRLPLRNSLMPSRRHSLQTGSVVRPIAILNIPTSPERQRRASFTRRWRSGLVDSLHAAFLGGPAAVVRQRRDVFDGLDVQSGGLQGGDGRLTARTRSLDAHLDFLEAKLGGALGGHFGSALGGERRTLTTALEADRARRGVAQRVAVGVGDGDNRVVERRLDVGHAPADVTALLAFLALGHGCNSPRLAAHLLDALLAGDGLARPLARAGVGAGSLATHWQAAPVSHAAIALNVFQPGDVLLHHAAERTFDRVFAVENVRQPCDLL